MRAVTRSPARPNASAGTSSRARSPTTAGVAFSIRSLVSRKISGRRKMELQESSRTQQQNRHADPVLDAGGGGSQEHVGEKAVAVGTHGHEVASLLPDPLDDFIGGFAESQFGVGRYAGGIEFFAHLVKISGILGDFGTDRVRPIGAGGPSI